MITVKVLTMLTLDSACHGDVSCPEPMDCKPCHCRTSRRGGIVAICTGLGLTAVPDSIPSSTKVLLLNSNNLKHMSEGMFKRFSLLERLDIASCNITSMDAASLPGLNNLKILNLADNELLLNNRTYPPGLFGNLQKLKVLDISNNDNKGYLNSTYNLKAFSDLVSLEKLFIDGLNLPFFGEGFEKLNLSYLSLSGFRGYCSIKHLSNSSFKHLPHLRYLNASHCEIFHIDNNAFGPLRYIETLDLTYNWNLGFETLGKALYGLQHSPLRVLDISYIVPNFKSVHLQLEDLIYINQTKLKVLHIYGNGIQTMNEYVPTLLTHVTHLYMRANRLLFGLYLFATDPMTSLQYLDISYGHSQQKIPFLLHREQTRSIASAKKRNSVLRYGVDPYGTFTWNPKLMIPIPHNVRTLNGSHRYAYGRIDLIPISPNNLTMVDLSFNLLTALTASCPNIDKLEFLDISNNYLSNLSTTFLKFSTEVRVLNFSHNYLAKSFSMDKEGLTFLYNTRLKILRIALNSIESLPEPFFQKLCELEILDVSNNELTNWEPKIFHMTKLYSLDISGNRLEYIPLNLRNDINELTTGRTQPLVLMISGNTFMCDCSHLHYLTWLHTANIKVTDLSLAKCKWWNGNLINMFELDNLLMDLHRHCHVITPLIFGTVGCIIFFIIVFFVFLISGMVYRYRWKLRYLYYTTKRKHRGYQRLANEDENAFVYDAFISHADEDRGFVINDMRKILEETFGLKLCIHHRDFIVGQDICENIINAIQTSRKTIVILSPNFVKSAWCDYEVHMAKLEGIHTGPDVICVVVYKDVPDRRNMSTDLLHEIAHGTYIEYPEELEGRDLFWNSLRDAIISRG